MQQLIRPYRSWFRQQYPLRYFLDILRLHMGPVASSRSSSRDKLENFDGTEPENCRQFIWQIVRIYLSKNCSFQEVQSIVSFLCESNDTLVCECLDTVKACLDIDPQPDQLVLLLYEPSAADLLYGYLVTEHSFQARMKALQVINQLLMSRRVYEANKGNFQLKEIEFFGLLNRIPKEAVTEPLLDLLFYPMFYTPENLNSMASILNFIPRCELDIQKILLRKLIAHCRNQSNLLYLFIQQNRWQPLISAIFPRTHISKRLRSATMTSRTPSRHSHSSKPELVLGGGDDTNLQIGDKLELCLSGAVNESIVSQGSEIASASDLEAKDSGRSGVVTNDEPLIDLSASLSVDDVVELKEQGERPPSVVLVDSPPLSEDEHLNGNEQNHHWPPGSNLEFNSSFRASSPTHRHRSNSQSSESSSIVELSSVPLTEQERSVLSALLDFIQMMFDKAIARLSFQEQIKVRNLTSTL